MWKKCTALLMCLVLLLAAVGCNEEENVDPVTAGNDLGCEPLSLITSMASSYAITDGKKVYFKKMSDGALYSADEDFTNLQKLADGNITGLNRKDDVLYYSAVTGEGEDQTSVICSIGTNGENQKQLYQNQGEIRQLLRVGEILYFVREYQKPVQETSSVSESSDASSVFSDPLVSSASDTTSSQAQQEEEDPAKDLMRCNLNGENVATVMGGEYTVDSYAIHNNKIYFTGNFVPNTQYQYMQSNDYRYTVFETSISGGSAVVTEFRRGENLFTHNGQMYGMPFYAAPGFILDEYNMSDYTMNESILLDVNTGFFWSIWMESNDIYLCTQKSKNIRRYDRASKESTVIYNEKNEDEVYFTGLCVVGDYIMAIDSNNVQYTGKLGDDEITLTVLN